MLGCVSISQVSQFLSALGFPTQWDINCQNGGQRICTVLMYLNEVAEGGSTFFRRINFEVRPKRGAAVLFFPGFMNGELDTDALHAGMPAVDVKWVSQIWIRQLADPCRNVPKAWADALEASERYGDGTRP